ncbi:MAG: hypothetical protein A2X64_08750 [Ignavibacteria bacterium GWF2_33_9]|nr:MAG: hypothetical protein A2X64_08750 [Ignavibacteria bacterium GWF2_33_9]
MKKYLLLLLLIPSLFAVAQDWQLFNTDYITYYRLANCNTIFNQKVDKIYEFQFRKEKISENDFLFTSERITPKNSSDSCLLTIRQQYYSNEIGEDGFLIDKYSITNDTIYCYNEIFGELRNENNNYILPLNMDKNDSLIFNKHKIKFVETKQVEVLEGLYDSAKVYFIEDMEYIQHTFSYITLTKHFGIIDYLYNEKYKLYGLKKLDNSESYGYIPQKGDISDLMNIKVGDFKIWETYYFEMGEGDTTYYSKDVCNSITFSNDSIVIDFVRTQYDDEKPVWIYYIKETYVKTLWDKMIGNRQNTIHFINIAPSHGDYNKMGISIVEGAGYIVFQDSDMNSTNSMIKYTDDGEYLIGNCESSYITDHNTSKIISCRFGEVYLSAGSGFGGFVTSHLIGYKSENIQYGEIPDFLLSVNEPSANTILLYPNPTTSTITLTGVPEGVAECRIFDVLSNCVITVETVHELSLQQIDVSALPSGVYFLRVGYRTMKFIKI